MKNKAMLLLLPALLIGLATAAQAREIDKNFHETFEVDQKVRLHLDHGDGSVTITPWDKDVLDVTVRYNANIHKLGWGPRADFHVDVPSRLGQSNMAPTMSTLQALPLPVRARSLPPSSKRRRPISLAGR